MHYTARFFALLFALGLSLVPASVYAGAPVPRFEPADCPFDVPPGRTIRCGFLIVPEDRAQPDSPTIKVGVAVLKSNQPHPEPDPVIWISGGPGGSMLLFFDRNYARVRPFANDLNRDVILFDQRGAGWSQPALDCPELAPLYLRGAHGEAITLADEQAPYLACRDRWTSAGVNLAAYTTADLAADVNDLWRTLGYESVNLYGISYGTVLAETLLRDYPEGVRTVILDSAYPLEISLAADTAANMGEGLQNVVADCTADWLCRVIYPDLDAVYRDLVEQLNRSPAPLPITDPVTGQAFTYPYGAAELGDSLRLLPARQIPGLIYDLHDGNYAALVEDTQEALKVVHQFGGPLNRAMVYSVVCNQGLYAETPAQRAAAASYPEAAWAERFKYHLAPLPCAQWPTRGAPDSRPLLSDLPVLIFSGEDDLTRSPEYDAIFLQNLPHAHVVAAPNSGHGVVGSPCTIGIIQAFLHDPRRPPQADCIASANRPLLNTTFSIRGAVARWPAQALSLMLGLVVGASAMRGAQYARQYPARFSGKPALRVINWVLVVGGLGLLGLGFLRPAGQILWATLPRALETVLAPLAALLAALAFSPEDEPALEVTLACPRPLAWLVLERLLLIFALTVGAGVLFSLWATRLTGETLLTTLLRWMPPVIFFSGLATWLTLITRRAIFSVALVSLVWFAASALGDLMIRTWPFTWPLNPYLQPTHPEYTLNRWLITLLGLGSLIWGLTMLRDEERLLLGGGRTKKARQATGRQRRREASAQPAPSSAQLPVNLHQLAAIVRYEFRLQWRRRAMSVVMLALIALPVVGALTLGRQVVAGVAASGLTPEKLRVIVTAQLTPTWLVIYSFLTLLVPVVVAETIPKDQHHGVRELLDSLPLSPGVYLAGKVLSQWAAVLAGLLLGMGVIGAVWWLGVGPFDGEGYVRMWLLGAAPLALMNPTLSVLLAAGQPTQRRALLVGLGFAAACLILQVPGFLTLTNAWSWVNPSRPVFFLYFLVNWNALDPIANPLEALVQRWITPQALAGSLVIGLAQTALVWAVVWAWMRKRST